MPAGMAVGFSGNGANLVGLSSRQTHLRRTGLEERRHLAQLEVYHRRPGKGELANFTWITPVCDDSDHTNCPDDYGPSWVSALVNTVGKSKFWNSTAIFIQWDDWGGLYDPVAPEYKDRDSLGFRVPLIMLSPYVKHDHVSHVPLRNRERAALRRRSLWAWVSSPKPTLARTRRQATVSTSRKSRPSSFQSRRPCRRSSSCVSTPTMI